MSNREVVLQAEHVTKVYRRGVIGSTTLRADIQTKWAKLRGKEDPNSIIGSVKTLPEGAFCAVDDVSFTARKGERIGLIGRNGAGKSTLLKLICRITAPTDGRIMYNGRVTSMLEVGTGFHPELTGRENIYLNGSIMGMSRSEIAKRIDDIVEFAEIGEFVDTPVKRYSSGMYVRLAFSVSAHLNADIVIMDEVLAVGDVQFQQKCIARMREIAETDNKTIIYVSHNMETVRSLCDRCMVMDHGRLIYDGNVAAAESIYRGELTAKNGRNYEENSAHRHLKADRSVKILKAEYPDGQSEKTGDTLYTRLRWVYQEDVEDLHFRIEIRSGPGRTAASSMVYDLPGGKAGQQMEAVFETDISSLQNGHYITTYVMVHIPESRVNVTADLVDGLSFLIRDPQRESRMIWNAGAWSRVQLPGRLESIREVTGDEE